MVRRRVRTGAGVVIAWAAGVGGLGVGGLGGCGRSETTTRDHEVLNVSAAASLTDVVTSLADRFERQHPGVEVRVNLGSSSALAAQVIDGAPVDVLLTADSDTLRPLHTAGLLRASPRVFAHNHLVLVVKPGNPRHLRGLADLSELTAGGGVVALCASGVPCGRLADRLLADRDVRLDRQRVTRGTDARTTLAAVSAGDADAAMVYATDARAAGDRVAVVRFPGSDRFQADPSVARPTTGNDTQSARLFVESLTGAEGRELLDRAGFSP